ncbi:MAG: hypothetical protein QNJ30_21195 [Kiloniellales bacterium]|nr:hypothetical protein [Kiloniellales bacterium]
MTIFGAFGLALVLSGCHYHHLRHHRHHHGHGFDQGHHGHGGAYHGHYKKMHHDDD